MLAELAALPGAVHTSLSLFLGLLVGSFLNVVIYRYPNLLKYQWSAQSSEWLNGEPYAKPAPPGIVAPGSHCGHCKAPVRAWQNIPIISYLLLRGRCASCQQPFSIRYPLVELLTGLVSAYVVHHFGWSVQAVAAIALSWVLIVLTFIDFDHQLLPDDIVLPVLWLGLGLSLLPVFAEVQDSVLGAIAGYLSLWLVFQAFKLLTGKEGMGHGDFKLLALFGAWLGWQMLPQIILVSTVVGSLVGITLMALKKASSENAIPFGPYIALAGWIAMLWGEQINQTYLRTAGF
ncbi:MAG: A24 family peptidase [Pseudomonadota bacterium]